MKATRHYFLLTSLFFSIFAFAQEGILDTSFGNNGYVYTDFFNDQDESLTIIQQDDQKILVAGKIEENDNNKHALARYLPDGTLDSTFGEAGKVVINLDDGYTHFNNLAVLNDGKIIAAGAIGLFGQEDILIARFLENGDLDDSFGVNGMTTLNNGYDQLASLEILDNGKILVFARTSIGSNDSFLLARFLTNGDLDSSFGDNGVVVTQMEGDVPRVYTMDNYADGKILVGLKTDEAIKEFKLYRYLEDGILDTSFGDNGIVTSFSSSAHIYNAFTLKEDGKIVTTNYASGGLTQLSQLMPDGSLDTDFAQNGFATISINSFVGIEILLVENDYILVMGNLYNFEGGDLRLLRYHKDGTLDTSFGTGGIANAYFEATDVNLQTNGKIIVTGYTHWYDGAVDFCLVRFNGSSLTVSENPLEELRLFPNPSNGVFNLRKVSSESIPYLISDISGKIIQRGSLVGNETAINLSKAQSGIYFLNISGQTMKLIKE